MILRRISDDAYRVLEVARLQAEALNHNYLGTEHLLLALTVEDFGPPSRALAEYGITEDAIKNQVARELETGSAFDDDDVKALAAVGIDLEDVRSRVEENFGPFALDLPRCPTGTPVTDKTKRALRATGMHARRLGHRKVGPGHLLLALLDDRSALAVKLIERLGVPREDLRETALRSVQN